MALNAQIALSLVSHETSSQDISSEMRVTPASYGVMLTTGTGANQAQVAWSGSYSWDEGTTVPYFLQGLSDNRGTLTMSSLKVFYIKNKGTAPLLVNTSNFAEGPIRSSGKIEIQGGGIVAMVAPTAAGWPTGASSSIAIDRQSSAASANFDILLIGEGAIS